MIEGLRRAGVTVIECHEQLWHGIDDRERIASGGWINPYFWWRILLTYARLIMRYRTVDKHDIVIVGYPGQLDVFIAWILCLIYRKPLVWDIFMSIYLIALERGLDRKSKASIRLLRWLEQVACRLPDRLILDTEAYVSWFISTYGSAADNFRIVPTGADDRVFQPSANTVIHNGCWRILYHGSFIPNHGVLHIIEAARLLADNTLIQFELIGTGPERDRARELAKQYNLNNVTFIEWLEKKTLAARVARAHICLGSFGTTPQSLMTIQNKIYEALGLGKSVITGDSSTVRSVFEHKKHLYICHRENPLSLAQAIIELQGNPELCKTLAAEGHKLFMERFTIAKIGALFKQHLIELLRFST